MNEIVEKAAKAMWATRGVHVGNVGVELEAWGDGSIPRLNGIMDEARAAIKAMREPTEAMLKAPEMATWAWRTDERVEPEEIADAWRAMIDAALEDK